jgi:hypothetical protein
MIRGTRSQVSTKESTCSAEIITQRKEKPKFKVIDSGIVCEFLLCLGTESWLLNALNALARGSLSSMWAFEASYQMLPPQSLAYKLTEYLTLSSRFDRGSEERIFKY